MRQRVEIPRLRRERSVRRQALAFTFALSRRWLVAIAALASYASTATRAAAQHDDHAMRGDSLQTLEIGAMATVVASQAWPLVLGRTIREGYLTQPMLTAALRAAQGHVRAYATLNLEGRTLERGEIAPGAYGEGYIDRRHPHTYLHELMVGAMGGVGAARVSLFAGKGFVPFGSDDPMMRPFEKYPVNHHLAQLIERAMGTAALRAGAFTLEGASFNGDEPEGASDLPNEKRLFDSWAARGAYRPNESWEFTVSAARVKSPEDAEGFGLDHRKSHASVRMSRPDRRVRYALVEWARSAEFAGSRRAYAFTSLLAEGAMTVGSATIALRVERSDRPEEQRSQDAYRSNRPLLDFGILGVTRWDVVTLHADGRSRSLWRVRTRPFIEGAWHHAHAKLRPTAVDPAELYGTNRLWMLSAGIRLDVGGMRSRMGYYGSAP
jgi:hypothetical protein